MNKGTFVASHGQYEIRQWTGPQVESGEMKPFSASLRGDFSRKPFATLEEAQAYIKAAPAKRLVKVEFEAYVPVDATEDEIEAWIEFELHANGSIQTSNPLSRHSLEARDVQVDIK